MGSRVQIPKGLLIGLVAVAGAAVLGLVFLLGRETGRSGPAPAAPPSPAPMAAAADAPAPAVAVPEPAPALPSPEPAPVATPAPLPPPPSSAKPAPAADADQQTRAAVTAYFKAVDALQPQSGGDPQQVAEEVVGGLGKGDTSGVDNMVQQAQATRDRLAAITPPQPCAAYHQALLASLDDGLDMLRAIRRMVTGGDPNAASSAQTLAARANDMKTRSDALRAQEQALRKRYCY